MHHFKSDRRSVLTAALLASSLLAVHASAATPEPRRGGSVSVAASPEPAGLVSAFGTEGNMQMISAKIHDGLLSYDKALKPVPALAQSWSISPDGRLITFQLRPGVKWHDGKPFTSADVKFTIENILPKYNSQGQGIFGNVLTVRTPNDLTAQLVMKAPSPQLLAGLSGFVSPMLPKHIYDGSATPNSHPAISAPIGTGPFRFVEWVKGSHVIVKRNDDYWDKGRPYLDQMIFKFIPDPSTRVIAFEKGEVDVGTLSPVPINEMIRLSKLPQINVTSEGFGLLSSVLYLGFNLQDPIMKDVRVRRAMAHALDLKAMARVAWGGTVTPATSPVSDQLIPFHAKGGLPAYPFDRKKAEALLDSAGYKRGANGVRFAMTLDPLIFSENHRQTAEFIREQLKQVGIEVTNRNQDVPSFIRRIFTDRDFQAYHHGSFNMADPVIGMQRLYNSKSHVKGVAFANGSGYSNPKMDKLWEEAQTEVEPQKRFKVFTDIQKLAMEDLPYIPLLNLHYQNILSKRVQNFDADGAGAYGNFSKVWVSN